MPSTISSRAAPLRGFWLYGLVYAALVVVQSLGVFLFVRGAGRLEMDMSYDIRQDAFAKLQQLSFSFLRHHLRWLADGPHGE